ncbi:MAG: cytidylate kinase-like family protein [Eubacteriales bacterium]|nr:cytidylate kinase-like family protein [Eubacteriales bacterium]
MGNCVITIGRQFGSGGHEVGRRLSERLGFAFYDKELLTHVAEKTGFHQDYLQEQDEKVHNVFFGGMMMGKHASFYQESPSDKIFIEQSFIIKELAEKGNCIIVGRCADYILRDMGSINLFIHAPMAERVQRKLELLQEPSVTAAEMEKQIRLVDKQRAQYYNYYTEQKWGRCDCYHLSIDTGKVGIDGAVNAIVAYLENCDTPGILPD